MAGAPPTGQQGRLGLGGGRPGAKHYAPMSTAERRAPRIRPVYMCIEQGAHGRVLVLRDTEGIAPSAILVPAELGAVVVRLDGRRSPAQIAAEASRAAGVRVDAAMVERLVDELDDASMLDTPRFRAMRREIVRAFTEAPVRPAAHAGGAYHRDPGALARYIEDDCLARAPSSAAASAVAAAGRWSASARPTWTSGARPWATATPTAPCATGSASAWTPSSSSAPATRP